MFIIKKLIIIGVFLLISAGMALIFQHLFNWAIPYIWHRAPYMPYWIAFAITVVANYAGKWINIEVDL